MLGYRKPMSLITHFLLFFTFFFFFFFFLSNAAAAATAFAEHEPVKLDLLHRHHPKVMKKIHGEAKVLGIHERLKDIHEHDQHRHRMISETLKQSKEKAAPPPTEEKAAPPPEEEEEKVPEENFPKATGPPIGLTTISAADYGSSQYFVQLKIGTPPQKFLLIADTGSDLTWVNCRYRRCRGNCTANPARKNRNAERKFKFKSKVFLANQSSSFRLFNCSSPRCKNEFTSMFALTDDCPTPASPCIYDYEYAGGATARGFFALDTITVCRTDGEETKMENTVVGCTESMNRVFVGADGVAGLGSNYFSLTSKASTVSPGGLIYCLVDHLSNASAVSYMILGPPGTANPSVSGNVPVGKMTHTKLLIDANFYGVDLVGISVDGQMLTIPSRAWDFNNGGGTIMDSGTSLTIFTSPVYDALAEALTRKMKLGGALYEFRPFEFCVNGDFDLEKAPRMKLHFSDGAVFSPPPKSYYVPALPNTTCLGFVSTPFPNNNVIGNILQQNHLWEYDFFKRTLGFAPSECY